MITAKLRIELIKEVREQTGLRLVESKDIVDRFTAEIEAARRPNIVLRQKVKDVIENGDGWEVKVNGVMDIIETLPVSDPVLVDVELVKAAALSYRHEHSANSTIWSIVRHARPDLRGAITAEIARQKAL